MISATKQSWQVEKHHKITSFVKSIIRLVLLVMKWAILIFSVKVVAVSIYFKTVHVSDYRKCKAVGRHVDFAEFIKYEINRESRSFP